jgi:ABC-type molybdate transport system permease subunit
MVFTSCCLDCVAPAVTSGAELLVSLGEKSPFAGWMRPLHQTCFGFSPSARCFACSEILRFDYFCQEFLAER